MKHIFALAGACLALAGCDRTAHVESGIEVEVKAVSTPVVNACAAGVAPGVEGQSFCTAEGERIDLINGLLVPFPVRVVECTTVASLLHRLATAALPSAYAHGGHVDAPAGVVDVAEPAGTTWTLGAFPATPGSYCGVELTLERLPEAAVPHESVAAPHDDVILYAQPCHFPNPPPPPPAYDHQCYTVAVHGTAPVVRLDFAGPVTLDASRRSLSVAVDVRYDTWLDGVDFSGIEDDPVAQAGLLQNIVDSLSARAQAGVAP